MNGIISSGQILDQSATFEVENMYANFATYFHNPAMTKIKDVQNYSMYITKTNALLGIEYRYIIVFVYADGFPVGTVENMSKLPWISLQTRTLKDNHKLSMHAYYPRKLPSINKPIYLSYNDQQQYLYRVEGLPIEIVLLPKRGTENEYNAQGTVITAIETYQTIITLKK